MKILLLGAGGRAHALAAALRRSAHRPTLYFLPGNAGTASLGEHIALDINDFAGIVSCIRRLGIQMIIPGTEGPLVGGIRDYIEQEVGQDIYIIGPHAAAARLEGSKAYAKAFMLRHNIPTAPYRAFSAGEEVAAEAFLRTLPPPYVVKADGLSGGKGVHICDTLSAATLRIQEALNTQTGQGKVVIETFLSGEELSFFVLVGKKDYLCLPTARDYKQIGDGNTGPNTGGMGAVSPGLGETGALAARILKEIVHPTLRGLKDEGIVYEGFLFFGLMVVDDAPYMLEYNVRLGDPETQAIVPRIQSDLLDMLLSSCIGRLHEYSLQIDQRKSVALTMASAGYPGDYETGKRIEGLNPSLIGTSLFLAGTRLFNTQYYTAGGRVLMPTVLAESVEAAAARCYELAAGIRFEGAYYRRDIGKTSAKQAQNKA